MCERTRWFGVIILLVSAVFAGGCINNTNSDADTAKAVCIQECRKAVSSGQDL